MILYFSVSHDLDQNHEGINRLIELLKRYDDQPKSSKADKQTDGRRQNDKETGDPNQDIGDLTKESWERIKESENPTNRLDNWVIQHVTCWTILGNSACRLLDNELVNSACRLLCVVHRWPTISIVCLSVCLWVWWNHSLIISMPSQKERNLLVSR